MTLTGAKHPARLFKGKTVALVAPAFSFDPTLMEQGRAFLQTKYGLKTVHLESLHDRDSYFAGSDKRRADELVHWLTNPEVDALFAVRGGYGCARIYADVIERLRAHKKLKPKIVVGYSDLTVLLNGLHQDLGWTTFHAPVLTGRPFRAPLPIEEQTFYQSLFTTEPLGVVTDQGMRTMIEGQTRGEIVGGCLSLLASSIGTSYEIRTEGKVLFIEDVDERPYRLDRMVLQLLHAGKLESIRGLVIGQLPHCEPPVEAKDPSQTSAIAAIQSVIEPYLRHKAVPVVYDFPAGHGMPQVTFPIGVEVEIRAAKDRPEVEFLAAGVK